MSTPPAAFLLVCPTCSKKYKGNPGKPNARYKCPADQTELVRPEAAAQTPPPPPPAPPQPESTISQDYETTQRMAPPSPESNYEATQKITAPKDNEVSSGFDYQATQKIEIETQSYEQTQKIETSG